MLNQPPPELFAEPPIRSNFGRRPPRRTFSRAGLLAGGVLLLVIAAGVGFLVSGSGTGGEEAGVPTIAAEMPIKQKPDQPGGIDIPHQDVTVFQKLEKEGEQKKEARPVENLLPSPEVPALATETTSAMMPLMDETAQKKAAQGAVEGAAVATESVAGALSPSGGLSPSREEMVKDIADSQIAPDVGFAPDQAQKGGASSNPLEDKLGGEDAVATTVSKVSEKKDLASVKEIKEHVAAKEVPVAKDVVKDASKDVGKDSAAKETLVLKEVKKEPKAEAKSEVKKETKASATATTTTSATLPKELFTGDPSAITKMAKAAVKDSGAKSSASSVSSGAAVASGASVASGGYAIQLASIPDQAKAQEMMAKLKGQYASALGGAGLRLVKADLAGKGTYYRIQSTGLSEASARTTCASLKASGAACIIVRP